MREIEFRARSKFDKNKKWVYGDLIQGENCYISTKEEFYSAVVSLGGHLSTFVELVDKETIGQYTGLKDKNGKKIFEGDILYDNFYKRNLLVKYVVEWGRYILDEIDDRDGNWLAFENVDFTEDIEIIGNIYDNPELLGEK